MVHIGIIDENVGINPEYLDTILYLQADEEICNDIDWTQVDIVNLVESALCEAIMIWIYANHPESIAGNASMYPNGYRDLNEEILRWEESKWYMLNFISSEVQVIADSIIAKALSEDGKTDCEYGWWDIVNVLVMTSSLNSMDSPIIQLYHGLIKIRDTVNNPSYCVSGIMSVFVSELTNLLADSGYFDSGVKRIKLSEINVGGYNV